ncbi:MAG: DUF835 domain-containing protein [Thermoplasmata archaeon]|nr:MAG: DUF835 domain-containing protein [Thermoplasmata archaeon]
MNDNKAVAKYDIYNRNPYVRFFLDQMFDKYGIQDYALITETAWNQCPLEIYPSRKMQMDKPMGIIIESMEELVLNQYLRLESDIIKNLGPNFESQYDEKGEIKNYNEGYSYLYLVKEENPEKSFRIFQGFLDVGVNGLCISNMSPETLYDSYGLDTNNIIWLCNTVGENTVDPKDLSKLITCINEFIENHGNSVILLDGLEYLITQNGLGKVLQSLNELNEQINKDSMFILPIHPNALRKNDLDQLEKGIISKQ